MPIPLRIGFIDAEGRALTAKREGAATAAAEHLVAFETSTGAITFTGLAARPIPALLRDFSAPVSLVDNLSTEDRLVQMAHDPDPFTRWEAGQTIARAAVTDVRRGANAPLSALAEALGRELARADADPDFAALALRLPDLAELIQTSDDPNPDELHAALERVRESLAATLKPQLLDIARRPSAPFSPDARSAGARALKAAALDLLAALGSETTHVLTGAFADARSMTEQVAALNALGANGASAFDGALDIFFQRWRANPLVVDKWFALQAAAPRADALARANALRAHAEFDLRTPNRVRALVMTFALRNPRAFHAVDGGGYRFLASIAAEVDAINPAVAARILGPFESWRRFDTGRQAQAKAALEGLAGKASLSKNAREIVERTLA
jgi:aminopeptidase N